MRKRLVWSGREISKPNPLAFRLAGGGMTGAAVNVCARAALPAPLCAPALQRRAHLHAALTPG